MNKTLTTILLVLGIIVLAGGIFFAGSVYARANMMLGWGANSTYGPGMMGRGGMMNGHGVMMGQSGIGPGMMNPNGYGNANIAALTIEQAKTAAQDYIQSLDMGGLEVGEVMIFDNHAYVIIEETETGLGAFELLIDPLSGIAYPEHGPNIMWNLKYGALNHENMMGISTRWMGMMGGYGMMNNMMGDYIWNSTTPSTVSAQMTVTTEKAIEFAQNYLDNYLPGATVSTHASQFYGYYTLDFEKDGNTAGMLSVNGFSGQVFLHTWHGIFIEEAE